MLLSYKLNLKNVYNVTEIILSYIKLYQKTYQNILMILENAMKLSTLIIFCSNFINTAREILIKPVVLNQFEIINIYQFFYSKYFLK